MADEPAIDKTGQIDEGLPPESAPTVETPPPPSGATEEETARKITVGDKAYTEQELIDKYQNSVSSYQRIQSERDRAVALANQSAEAWDWIRNNQPNLYTQLVDAVRGAASGQPQERPPAGPTGQPAPTPEGQEGQIPPWFQPYAEQVQRAAQLAEANENRYWDNWAQQHEDAAMAEYQKITGKTPPVDWRKRLYAAQQQTGAVDLVLLTRGLLHDDVVAGRAASTTEAAMKANLSAQRGATEGGESGGIQAPIDLSEISDDELYRRGKQALGLPTEDTRYVLDK